LYSHLL